jgi:hypothetical protein
MISYKYFENDGYYRAGWYLTYEGTPLRGFYTSIIEYSQFDLYEDICKKCNCIIYEIDGGGYKWVMGESNIIVFENENDALTAAMLLSLTNLKINNDNYENYWDNESYWDNNEDYIRF